MRGVVDIGRRRLEVVQVGNVNEYMVTGKILPLRKPNPAI